MTSSATRGLLAGVGKALGVAGEKGLDNQYEQIRMKKQQEYKLEGMEVNQGYAKENQKSAFDHESQMTADSQAHQEYLLDKNTEAKSGLLSQQHVLDTENREDTQAFEREENAKDRATTIAKSGKKNNERIEYLDSMLKNKVNELRAVVERDANMGEESSVDATRLRQEIIELEAEYGALVGARTGASRQFNDLQRNLLNQFMKNNNASESEALKALSSSPRYSKHFQ